MHAPGPSKSGHEQKNPDRTTSRLANYDRRAPRYTSYPTAVRYTRAVQGKRYRAWLGDLDLVADLLPGRHKVCHGHLGGGTPPILGSADMERLFERLRARFDVPPAAGAQPPMKRNSMPRGA